ncbi:hypothetical protein [Lacinutrix himadriensis]|uniref:hypothetical protein n=1 Tax=Lacinutrix himadriensis TaxID=641549 RepID=UPI0006E11F39|nr:hypothetical protein [Lacinutrix himadriensis]
MNKTIILKNIQKRLPENIIIQDETQYEFNDDEYLSILSWIKCFNKHYETYGMSKGVSVQFPIISKRIRLDFGLYRIPCELEYNKGKHIIYISSNGKRMDGSIDTNITTTKLIREFNL